VILFAAIKLFYVAYLGHLYGELRESSGHFHRSCIGTLHYPHKEAAEAAKTVSAAAVVNGPFTGLAGTPRLRYVAVSARSTLPQAYTRTTACLVGCLVGCLVPPVA
jgi:hypothetical protein